MTDSPPSANPAPQDLDLVNQLKYYANNFTTSYHWGKLMGEAAEEIERLREQLSDEMESIRGRAGKWGI